MYFVKYCKIVLDSAMDDTPGKRYFSQESKERDVVSGGDNTKCKTYTGQGMVG